jgi:hypothetical protein
MMWEKPMGREKGNQTRSLEYNKIHQDKPIAEPHGERNGAWRRLNSGI